MRIGILTLHDSVNYGAQLQAYALCAYLTSCGHDARVIDRRRDPGLRLKHPFCDSSRVRLLGFLDADAANGSAALERRISRSEAFLRDQVGLTSYRFSRWDEAPADLGVDVVSVGSDQVWNANNVDVEDYLLGRIPGSPRGIAYAASVGMPEFPRETVESFRRGLARFAAIGVREREAVTLVRSLGRDAVHVVDPVLLAGREVWTPLLAGAASTPRKVFAYFLAEDFNRMFRPLGRYARVRGERVDFFVDWFRRPYPDGLCRWLKNRRYFHRLAQWGIDLRLDAGPVEFIRSIASADTVVTNSFHALALAVLFGKDVRVVLPTHPVRRAMNARLTEFGQSFVRGPLICGDLDEALASLASGQRITVDGASLQAKVAGSRTWLDAVLSRFENKEK